MKISHFAALILASCVLDVVKIVARVLYLIIHQRFHLRYMHFQLW